MDLDQLVDSILIPNNVFCISSAQIWTDEGLMFKKIEIYFQSLTLPPSHSLVSYLSRIK